jgi:glycosyltransferase involved in cell wall biosynthesis
MKTLYICYFGVREPLVQTQVIPYLREIARGGVGVNLLTFEPGLRPLWDGPRREAMAARLLDCGIRWHCLAYHKRPSLPATLFDVAAGALRAARLIRREGIDVLHARCHVAGLIAALVKARTGRPMIFDVRGFNPEEYVDAGVWADGGLKFRLAKRAERMILGAADGFVVLTDKARAILFPGATDRDDRGRPVEVIPCCADLERFRPPRPEERREARSRLGLDGRRVYAYVGSLGGFYLTREMAEFLAVACRWDPAAFVLILSQSDPAVITAEFARLGVTASSYRVLRVTPEEVPRHLWAADVAVSFVKPTFSKQAASPTKVGEYLACGLPIVCNAGVGDVDEVVTGDRVGVVVRELSDEGYRQALLEADALAGDPGVSRRCRHSAKKRYDLADVGGVRYRRLYDRLPIPPGAASLVREPLPWTS